MSRWRTYPCPLEQGKKTGKPVVLEHIKALQIGTSIGLAFYPGDAESTEDLVRFADIAMYAAKSAGGGVYKKYEK